MWLRRTWTRNWMRSLGLLGGCWSWAGVLVNCGRDDCCCGLGARFGAAIPATAGTTRERERDAQISCSSGTRRTRSDRVAQNSSLSPHRLADKANQAPTQHSVTCYDASRARGGGGAAQFTRPSSFHDHDLHDTPRHASRTSRCTYRTSVHDIILIILKQYTVTMFLVDISPSMGKTRQVSVSGPDGKDSETIEMTNLEWSLQYVMLKIQEMVSYYTHSSSERLIASS